MRIDMRKLDDGTRFLVNNGYWYGYIFSKNDKKFMHIECTNTDMLLTGNEDLDIKIVFKYAHEKPDGTGHWTGGFNDEKWISILIREFGVNEDTAQVMFSEMTKIYNEELERSKK